MTRPSKRDHVLKAAAAVAAEPGRLTLDRVAERADMSKGGILYHFPDRSSLMQALVQSQVSAFHASIDHPDDAIWAHRYIQATLAGSTLDRGWLAVVTEDPSMVEPLREQMRRWHARAKNLPGLLPVLLAADAIWYALLLGLPVPEVDLFAELERVLEPK